MSQTLIGPFNVLFFNGPSGLESLAMQHGSMEITSGMYLILTCPAVNQYAQFPLISVLHFEHCESDLRTTLWIRWRDPTLWPLCLVFQLDTDLTRFVGQLQGMDPQNGFAVIQQFVVLDLLGPFYELPFYLQPYIDGDEQRSFQDPEWLRYEANIRNTRLQNGVFFDTPHKSYLYCFYMTNGMRDCTNKLIGWQEYFTTHQQIQQQHQQPDIGVVVLAYELVYSGRRNSPWVPCSRHQMVEYPDPWTKLGYLLNGEPERDFDPNQEISRIEEEATNPSISSASCTEVFPVTRSHDNQACYLRVTQNGFAYAFDANFRSKRLLPHTAILRIQEAPNPENAIRIDARVAHLQMTRFTFRTGDDRKRFLEQVDAMTDEITNQRLFFGVNILWIMAGRTTRNDFEPYYLIRDQFRDYQRCRNDILFPVTEARLFWSLALYSGMRDTTNRLANLSRNALPSNVSAQVHRALEPVIPGRRIDARCNVWQRMPNCPIFSIYPTRRNREYARRTIQGQPSGGVNRDRN